MEIEIEPAKREEIESEILIQLKRVRLVFELGFPDDLVSKATAVIQSASGRLVVNGRIRYPACFVLHIVNLAKDRLGHKFWSSDELAHLRVPLGLNETQLAQITRETIRELKLETFDFLVEGENALRNMTPVTMHSGIPVNNMQELVRLIETAVRRHRLTAEDQIKYWSSAPNGFNGMWAAPRRLFQQADSIALDLLERINDVLRSAEQSDFAGLPKHLVDAILEIDEVQRSSFSGRNVQVPRPWIEINRFSCLGPTMVLPTTTGGFVRRWRVIGSAQSDVDASENGHAEMPLLPSADYEVSAVSSTGELLSTRSFKGYGEVPVYFFRSSNGHLLEQSAGSVDIDEKYVLALVHPKASVESEGITPNDFSYRINEWADWKLIRIDVEVQPVVVLRDTTRSEESVTTVRFRRGHARPSLTQSPLLGSGIHHEFGPIYPLPPSLRMEVGEVDTDLITVIVKSENDEISMSLSGLDHSNGQFNIGSMFVNNGEYVVSVVGPMGLNLRPQKIVFIRDFSLDQDPPVALPGDVITLELQSEDYSELFVIPANGEESKLEFKGMVLRVKPAMLEWSLGLSGRPKVAVGISQFEVGVESLSRFLSPLLYLHSGLPVDFSLDLVVEGVSVLEAPERMTNITDKWIIDLARFSEIVKATVAESLTVRVRAGEGRWIDVGRIFSEYMVTIEATISEDTEGLASIGLKIVENRPFNNRVLRLWNLDRPWEKSDVYPIPDTERGDIKIQMYPESRIGNFRLSIAIEGPSTAEVLIPLQGAKGTLDLPISFGLPLNPTDPIDRLIATVNDGGESVLLDGDIRNHGYVLIALIARRLADRSGRVLTERSITVIYRLLLQEPEFIVSHVCRALELGVIEYHERLVVSLSLLPILFDAEDGIDLEIDDDFAELVWSQLPWLAAAIEPWSESSAALQRWSQKLGWPQLEARQDMELDEEEVDEPGPVENPPLRTELSEVFDQDVRRIKLMTHAEIALYLGHLIGTRDGQPLSSDAEWDAVLLSIPSLYPLESQITEWRSANNHALSRAHHYVKRHEFANLFSQYVAKAVWHSDPQYAWVLNDVAVLALSAVDERENALHQIQALVDIARIIPRWVGYSILLAMSVRPYYSNREE